MWDLIVGKGISGAWKRAMCESF
jgi:hypothetical protein